jgi:hypothetical protein
MKALKLVLGAILLDATLAQPITYCGQSLCLVPINVLSCERLLTEYQFFGSCCQLTDIPQTGGCRVEVGSKGNCLWTPKCGLCDTRVEAGIKCNQEFRTDTDDACPDLEYDALAIQGGGEMPANTVTEGSSMPSLFPAPAPTCAPSASPVQSVMPSAKDAAASYSMVVMGLSLVLSTICTIF